MASSSLFPCTHAGLFKVGSSFLATWLKCAWICGSEDAKNQPIPLISCLCAFRTSHRCRLYSSAWERLLLSPTIVKLESRKTCSAFGDAESTVSESLTKLLTRQEILIKLTSQYCYMVNIVANWQLARIQNCYAWSLHARKINFSLWSVGEGMKDKRRLWQSQKADSSLSYSW